MEGRDSYLNLGKRSSSQNIVFTIAAALGSVLFAAAMLYYARSLLLPVQQMSRGASRMANTTWAIFIMHERTRSACWRIRSTISSIRSRGPSMRSEGEAQLEKIARHQGERGGASAPADRAEPLRAAPESDQSAFPVQHAAKHLKRCRYRTGERDGRYGRASCKLLSLYARPRRQRRNARTRGRPAARLYFAPGASRFGERISFEMDCDARCDSCMIPKFTLAAAGGELDRARHALARRGRPHPHRDTVRG